MSTTILSKNRIYPRKCISAQIRACFPTSLRWIRKKAKKIKESLDKLPRQRYYIVGKRKLTIFNGVQLAIAN